MRNSILETRFLFLNSRLYVKSRFVKLRLYCRFKEHNLVTKMEFLIKKSQFSKKTKSFNLRNQSVLMEAIHLIETLLWPPQAKRH